MRETLSERMPLPFEIDDRIDSGLITAHVGVPLVIELFRRVGAAQVVNGQVRIKQRQRGVIPAQLVETLIALWAAGGDRCQDLQTLRVDIALAALLGYELLASTIDNRGHYDRVQEIRSGTQAPFSRAKR